MGNFVNLPMSNLELKGFMNHKAISDNTATISELLTFAIQNILSYEHSLIQFLTYQVMPKLKAKLPPVESAYIYGYYNNYVYDGDNETIEPISAIFLKLIMEKLLVHKYIFVEALNEDGVIESKYDYQIPSLPVTFNVKPNNFYIAEFEKEVIEFKEKYYRMMIMFHGAYPNVYPVGCDFDNVTPAIWTSSLLLMSQGLSSNIHMAINRKDAKIIFIDPV